VGEEEKSGGRGKKTPGDLFPSQEAIDAAQIIVDIASSPGKRKAPPPDDDEEGLDAVIEEAIENDDYLTVAKEGTSLPVSTTSLYHHYTHTFRVPLIRTLLYWARHPWLAHHAHAIRRYTLPYP
jgi:hypothetical protein